MEETVGFIMTRHVNSETTNKYWIECYTNIRRFYPKNIIMIIDDNSDYSFIKDYPELKNTFVFNSEYVGRGELMPYYYFYKMRLFDRAIIIHDSTFIQGPLDLTKQDENDKDIQFLWHFENCYEHDPQSIVILLLNLNFPKELIYFFLVDKKSWCGCYGVQSIIHYDFLSLIVEKYNLFTLLDGVIDRHARCSLERVFAVVCTYEKREIFRRSFLGDIISYTKWGYTYEQYIEDKRNNNIQLPVVKVWTGR
jgi:hypothetical protein